MPLPQPHQSVPDGYGGCQVCPLPAKHRVHAVPDARARDVQERIEPVAPEVPRVGFDAPATSIAAAVAAAPRAGTRKAAALDVIASRGEWGATADEVQSVLGLTHQQCSPVMTALKQADPSPITPAKNAHGEPVQRVTGSGRLATVWVLSSAEQTRRAAHPERARVAP